MAYIIDADWVIEASKGNPFIVSAVERLSDGPIALSWLTAAEVYEIAYNSPNPDAYVRRLDAFMDRHLMIGVDRRIALNFAEIRAFLRRCGQMISDMDIVVAATALSYDLTVLTFNTRHFERIPDLRIYRSGP